MRKNIKILSGKITTLSMKGVAVVDIERKKNHRLYGKALKINKRIKAAVKNDDYEIGDEVDISEVRPQSKDVHFKIISKRKK